MAIGWLTVLSGVPWTDVIRNAPKVADGARKLWKRASGAAEATEPVTAPAQTAQEQSLAALQARMAAMETAVLDLQSQLVESSALIKQLADLNEQLILRVQVQGQRMRAMGILLALLTAALLLSPVLIVWLLGR